MIYFTSDLHLGHANAIRFTNRPFTDVRDMNRTLIVNYNAVVRPSDTVYLLGDLSYCISVREANALIAMLHGEKHLILGNHDAAYDPALFASVQQYAEISYARQRFVLMHYPILDWNHMRHGSIHVHGHIHSVGEEYNLPNQIASVRRYDAGVDANAFYPVSADAILRFFAVGEGAS